MIYPNPRPARAIEIAEQLTRDHPDDPASWSRLGQARVRARDWPGGQEALERVIRTARGGDVNDWLFLALARWHRGDAPSARRWYDQAADALDQSTGPGDPAIDLLRSEVADLIGAGGSPPHRKP